MRPHNTASSVLIVVIRPFSSDWQINLGVTIDSTGSLLASSAGSRKGECHQFILNQQWEIPLRAYRELCRWNGEGNVTMWLALMLWLGDEKCCFSIVCCSIATWMDTGMVIFPRTWECSIRKFALLLGLWAKYICPYLGTKVGCEKRASLSSSVGGLYL